MSGPSAAAPPRISAADVSFAYDGTPVLAGVALDAARGDVVGLIGPNGSGKTTLLRVLYAALRPDAGSVALDGEELHDLATRQLARRVAVVAQEAPPELPISVAELVLLGRSPHRTSLRSYDAEDHRIAAEALVRVGLREKAERDLASLSGGERQRALIARALAQRAPLMLLDEPTNHLDIRFQHEVLALLRGLDVTTVVVLHDLNLAARYCDRLVLLDRGAVARSGPPSGVLTPEALEPVYGVGVRVLRDAGHVQLVFRPRDPAAGGAAAPTDDAR